MEKTLTRLLEGYQLFREKYAKGEQSVLSKLAIDGQAPEIMVVSCCDSRADPALILQCNPGDLFIARNVAAIVPPYEQAGVYHGTSAALEFGIRFLNVKLLVLLGHSQCGGIQALLDHHFESQCDFISNWVSLVKPEGNGCDDVNACAKQALEHSYRNCLTFPWIKDRIDQKKLGVERWFFDIHSGEIVRYNPSREQYYPLDENF